MRFLSRRSRLRMRVRVMRMRSRRVRPRLERLEADAPPDERPWLAVYQDAEDSGAFYERATWAADGRGRRFTRDEFAELEKRFRLIVVEYVQDWRDGGAASGW